MASYNVRKASPYSEEDALTVEKAKRVHKETTASAQRALKTANKTKDLAANTLEELERQGDKLETIDQDLHHIDADVRESKGLLSYMQRCCLCFLCSCCCDCDPSVQEDKHRKSRVKQRNKDRSEFKGALKESRQNANGLRQDASEPEDEEDTRGKLFESKADAQKAKQAKQNKNAAYQIGKDLAEEDRDEILAETKVQEKTLDAIGDTLDELKRMGQAMDTSIKDQEAVLNRVTDHVENTHTGLLDVQASAEKTLGKKGTRQVNRSYMNKAKVASTIARNF